MSYSYAEIVAQTLEIVEAARQAPQVIDEAYRRGAILPNELVITSMGNVRKAVLTPAYPALVFESKLLQRLDWSAINERPFVEVAIHAKKDERFNDKITLRMANITLRLCINPTVEGNNNVLQTSASFPLDSDKYYGTTESVIKAIIKNIDRGNAIDCGSGFVVVPPLGIRSNEGKWKISNPLIDHLVVADTIQEAVSKLPFVEIVL